MNKFSLVLFVVLLNACSTVTESTSAKMEGTRASIRVGGYEDMCKREPESVLCTTETKVKKK